MALKTDYQEVMIRMKMDVDYIAEEAYKDGTKDGQNEAWEAARKIVLNPNESGLGASDLLAIFGNSSVHNVFKNYSASEAIAKLKAYEEKRKADDEIKVRDEVIWTQDENVAIVVTRIYTVNNMEWCDGVRKDGKVYHILTENARKTGRRFDIDKILEEMKK